MFYKAILDEHVKMVQQEVEDLIKEYEKNQER